MLNINVLVECKAFSKLIFYIGVYRRLYIFFFRPPSPFKTPRQTLKYISTFVSHVLALRWSAFLLCKLGILGSFLLI